VKRVHFATLQPQCVVCRAAPLAITSVIRERGDDVIEGIIGCTNETCLREYPIVNGIPILVGAIRGWLGANSLQVLQRDDLSPEIESLIGDALGPNSPFDTIRQHVGIYTFDHYESHEPAVIALLDAALSLAGEVPQGPAIDVGCSVGRTTFEIAARFGQLTVGIDLNFAMLRVASRALREGRVHYARRRVGLAYDRSEIDVDLPARELVDFWCCDASALPFRDSTFAVASMLNVIDCVAAPRDVLGECARVLRDAGKVLIATPYDWAPTATPVEQWLGGHSQRAPQRGASEPALHSLLRELKFEIIAERDELPWRLRLHDRSAVEYSVHVIAATRRS
jgi:SAM-dependent methyltransferase/uncharacterized protein YbaR (Trm112 family)